MTNNKSSNDKTSANDILSVMGSQCNEAASSTYEIKVILELCHESSLYLYDGKTKEFDWLSLFNVLSSIVKKVEKNLEKIDSLTTDLSQSLTERKLK